MADDPIPEVEVIKVLLRTLGPLKPDDRANVLDFVFRKLGIKAPGLTKEDVSEAGEDLAELLEVATPGGSAEPGSRAADIRTLKERKKPKSANQMVALIAYYLEHLAPEGERRAYITADDVRPLFNQANFELPNAPPSMTLINAKNAGYLNQVGKGRYRLNPVGHNLVAYKLPKEGTDKSGGGKKRASKKQAAKKAKRGKRKTRK